MTEEEAKDKAQEAECSEKAKGCEGSCSSCGMGDEKVKSRLKIIKRKIFVLSGKGGVGKSTVAVNLAWALADKGNKVGIMDLDIHGPNVPKLLGVSGSKLRADDNGMFPLKVTENLSAISLDFLIPDKDAPVVWRGPVKMGAIKQFIEDVNWGELDYMIVDLPPGTGDEALTIAQLIPDADGAVIVTTPQDLALMDSRKAIKFAQLLKLRVLGIVENMGAMKCPHCSEMIRMFPGGYSEKAASDLNVELLGSVPFEPGISEQADKGVPLVTRTESEAAKEFLAIVDKIEGSIEG